MKDKRYLKMLDYILINETPEIGTGHDDKAITNDPIDRGGISAYGIMQLTYDKWRTDEELEPRSVTEITGEEVECIYYIYYNESKANLINDFGIACYMFDCCVNHGARRSAIFLQRALKTIGIGITVDGTLGSVIINLVNSEAVNKRLLQVALINERKKFYTKIIERDRTQSRFFSGWCNRSEKTYSGE